MVPKKKNCLIKLRDLFLFQPKNNPEISPKYNSSIQGSHPDLSIPSNVDGSNLQDGLLPSPRVNRTTALPVCDSFGSEDGSKPLEVGENARFFWRFERWIIWGWKLQINKKGSVGKILHIVNLLRDIYMCFFTK